MGIGRGQYLLDVTHTFWRARHDLGGVELEDTASHRTEPTHKGPLERCAPMVALLDKRKPDSNHVCPSVDFFMTIVVPARLSRSMGQKGSHGLLVKVTRQGEQLKAPTQCPAT